MGDDARTVVLVGRAGNGKSATANSILGKKIFKSKISSAGVTSTCELKTAVLAGGQVVNVIDTPGLFDFSDEDFIEREIVKCITLAKEGIHAILVVFSTSSRFSKEEEAVLQSLKKYFGDKIANYMIIVYTGGDELEENGETLEDYLGHGCPEPLKEVLGLCKNRMILFDNKTKDEVRRAKQVQQLLCLVNMVVTENGGQPYRDVLSDKLKEAVKKEEIESYEEQLQLITEMTCELRLREREMGKEQIKEPCKKEACDIQACLTKNNFNSQRCQKVIELLQSCCEKCKYESTHCASVSGLLKQITKQVKEPKP